MSSADFISEMHASNATLSYPPHIKHQDTIRSMMADMLIAMAPAAAWGVMAFGVRALAVMLVSVAAAVASEAAFDVLTKRSLSILDLSAAVTGMLLAFSLPATAPLYVPALGAVFAVVVVKCLFGGLGCNPLNPALSGYVFLKLCFPAQVAVTGDPLSALKAGLPPDVSFYDIIVGKIPGNIGEVSALLLIAGGIYLILRGVADWRVPLSMLGSVVLISFLIPDNLSSFNFVMYELFSGMLVMAAFFMATDPTTTPASATGRVVFGILAGALTMLLRLCGTEPEGVASAILTVNLLSGVIDRITSPKPRRRAAGDNGAENDSSETE